MALNDLFKPKWKHSSAAVRLAAVREMGPEQQDVLLDVALTDDAADVRLAAVAAIEAPNALRTILDHDGDGRVHAAAAARLNGYYRRIVLSDAAAETRLQALKSIGDDQELAALFTELQDRDLRRQSVVQIRDPEVLCRIVECGCGRELGMLVVDRIDDDRRLARVAAQATNKAVRRRAAQRATELEAERNRPSPEALREREFEALDRAAQKLSESWHWDYARLQLTKASDRWDVLDAAHEHPRYARFAAAGQRLEERYTAFLQRQREEEAHAAQRAAAIAEREALCERVEAAAGSVDDDILELIDRTEAEWHALPAIAGERATQLDERFRAAVLRFRETRLQRLEEAQTLAEAQARLAPICARAAELAAAADREAGAKELTRLLRDHLPREDERHPGLEPLYAQLQAAGDHLREQRRVAREAERRRIDARTAELTALCEQIESLVDAEDRPAAEAEVKTAMTAFRAVNDIPRKLHGKLNQRFRAACDRFFERQREHRRAQDWERWANLTLKEELIAEAEKLVEAEDLHAAAKRVRELQRRWKEIGPVPRNKSQVAWERFHGACDAAYTRCKSFFAAMEEQRANNLETKRRLCAEVEALSDSEAWEETTARIKEMQEKWQAAGPVPKDRSEAVYGRFRAACDRFFERRRAHYQEQRREREDNLRQKTALADEAEKLRDSSDWRRTSDRLKSMQQRWKEIGPAPSHKTDEQVWQQFHGACNAFFTRFDALRPANLEKKQALCERAEALLAALDEDTNAGETARALIELQREWKNIGPAPADREEEVWKRFHKPCDAFFSGRREERERNEILKRDLLEEARSLSDSTDWHETGDRLKALQHEWKNLGPAPGEREAELRHAFHHACDAFFSRLKAHDGVQDENLRAKGKVCARIEFLAGIDSQDAARTEAASLSLAEQLQIALESNFITNASDARNARGAAMQEVRNLQQEWRRIGPVPRRHLEALNRRYRHACDAFFGKGSENDAQRPRESPQQMAENRKRKEALCVEVEALAAAAAPAGHIDAVRDCQKQWKQIGHVPSKADADRLWRRFKAACNTVYDARRASERTGA